MSWVVIIACAIFFIIGLIFIIKDMEKPFKVIGWIVAILSVAIAVVYVPYLVGNPNNEPRYVFHTPDLMPTPSPTQDVAPYPAPETTPIPIPEPDYSPISTEDILLGTWHGEYFAGQGQTTLQLIITDYTNGIISAYFYFSAHPENPGIPSGVYSMNGFVSENMEISLMGHEWIIRPGDFSFLNILGILDLDNMVISSDEASLTVRKVSNDTELRHNINLISNEGFLTSLDPWRLDGVEGFMINNDFSTLRGRGFPQGFVATSATNVYYQVVSVNNISPFEILYNLQGNYSIIRGRVGFDDITPSGDDGFMGVGASTFVGNATVTFLSDDEILYNGVINISTTGLPQPFELNVEGVHAFTIRFDFPWWNWVFENFSKHFNLIDVTVE